MLDIFGALYSYLETEIEENDLVYIWNEYCDKDKKFDDRIFQMWELDDYVGEGYATEILDRFSDDFSTKDDYFVETIYGIESFNMVDEYIYFDDLVEYIVRNEEDFGMDRIREIFEESEKETEE